MSRTIELRCIGCGVTAKVSPGTVGTQQEQSSFTFFFLGIGNSCWV